MRELNNDNFNEFIKEGLNIVEFYLPVCLASKNLEPILEEVSKELNCSAGKVNWEKETILSTKYKISLVPTILIFQDGGILVKLFGFYKKPELISYINTLLSEGVQNALFHTYSKF